MMDTPNEGKNVTAFLSENAGIYLYRPIFRRFMLCLGIFFYWGFPSPPTITCQSVKIRLTKL